MSLKIGAVSYLNTKPLIHGLRERLPDCELSFDLPSRLADKLSGGALDFALIPSVEFLRGKDTAIVSDACIACRGPVRSVRLLFRKPPAEVQTLALDEGSRTSAVLSRVLLAHKLDVFPTLQTLSIEADFSSNNADAVLVIGDRAMEIDSGPYVENWDLGQAWFELTGLPFVFAMWVAASGIPAEQTTRIATALEQSRDRGLACTEEISQAVHADYGLSIETCTQYFQEHLAFQLDESALRGISLFRKYATQYNILPQTTREFSTQLS